MTYRTQTVSFPNLPPLESDTPLHPDEAREVRFRTSGEFRMNAYNVVYPENREDKWGQPARLPVEAIIVSRRPFVGISERDTQIPNTQMHVAFRVAEDPEDPDVLIGLMTCPKQTPKLNRTGIIGLDARGRGWFMDTQTEDPTLEPVDINVPAAVRMFALGGQDLSSRLPVFGTFSIRYQNIYAVEADPIPANPKVNALIEERVAREDAIEAAVTPVLTAQAFGEILDTLDFPTKDGLTPDYHDKTRAAFDETLTGMARKALIRVRDAGLCAPCPNNGPRSVTAMSLWDTFLTGSVDVLPSEEAPFEIKKGYAWVMEIPAFKIFQNELIIATQKIKYEIWEKNNPGVNRDYGVDIPFTRDIAESVFPVFLKKIIKSLREEEGSSVLDKT